MLDAAARMSHGATVWAPPRASERVVAALGALCLKAFLAAQFLSLTRLFLANHLGEGLASLASLAGLFSVAFLAPAVLAYGLGAGSLFGNLVPAARVWASLVLALAIALFVYGWLGCGYVVTSAAHDFAPYLVILAMAVLGSIPRVWEDADGWMVALFLMALVVNALGMTEITRVVSEATADDRAGVSIVAYRTQAALAFWPLLLLTSRMRRPAVALLVFAGAFFVLAQQILFQKRSPTVRVLLFMLIFLIVLPLFRSQAAPGEERKTRTLFAATGLAALAIALTVAPWLFQGQLAGLTQRLSGDAYRGGATGMLTWENERFHEAGMFFRTLEPEDWIRGRGFGGYFIPDDPGWGVWLDDVNEFGRRQLHVGGLMPFFKGGLALALTYYAGLMLALARGTRRLSHPLGAAAFFVLLVHTLFLLQEGSFIMSAAFDLVVVGLCMGHLLSRHRRLDGRTPDHARGMVPA
jgi:hypothetical protein